MTNSRPIRNLPMALAALVLLAGAAGCGGSSRSTQGSATTETTAAGFSGPEATPAFTAPALVLRNSLGRRVDISKDRGKVVLITFLYTHCPDVCPLIAGHLHTVLSELGAKAGSVRLIAVSTDPRGDTAKTVKNFLAAHQLTGQMDYLIGSRPQLAKVWAAWNITTQTDKASPELVAHSALVYGVSAKGKVTTLYPSNFKVADVVHDVPLLAER